MITIGIDVGVTGALAAIDEAGEVVLLKDLPVAVHGSSKWIDGAELLPLLFAARKGDLPARVFVEHIHGTPKMGVTTSHSLGLTFGSVLSILQIARLPFEAVVPSKWKRALGLIMPGATDHEKKSASLDRARMLFPMAPLSRQKDNGRAEALLIAHYGQRHVLGHVAPATAAVASAQAGDLALVGGGKAA
jgi:crossover junction endodeoxyribonuclease RuvC